MSMMGAQGQVLELASIYLLIVLVGLPLKYIYFAYRAVSQGVGDSKTPRNLLCADVLDERRPRSLFRLGLGGSARHGCGRRRWRR